MGRFAQFGRFGQGRGGYGMVWLGRARLAASRLDGLGKGCGSSMLDDGERPRRPGKVIFLVVAFWVSGTILQGALRSAVEQVGVADVDVATRIGQIAGWGLLFVLSVIYRRQIDEWLRR